MLMRPLTGTCSAFGGVGGSARAAAARFADHPPYVARSCVRKPFLTALLLRTGRRPAICAQC
jgi:hypothetical protein